MRPTVSDTGPLLHLGEADALDLLSLRGEVQIPPEVESEMCYLRAGWPTRKPAWVIITSLTSPHDADAQAWQQARVLDAGEAQAIALARQLHADWLLTDDAVARLVAQSLGLEVHGSLGVVLWAAATGQVAQTEADSILTRLAESSLWLSASLLAEARAALREMFR